MPKKNSRTNLNLQNLNSTAVSILPVVLLGLIVYFNSLFCAFIWDDHALIMDNYLIKDTCYIFKVFSTNLFFGAGEMSNFYRPLQSLSLMLDFKLWRLFPIGYHLTNILLHILNGILVYYFLFLLLKDKGASLLAALLFLVHPVNTESVTYISGRADPLALLFFLAALISYINFYSKSKTYFYFLSVASFVLALLSKETALIIPLIIIIYDLYFSFSDFKKRIPGYLPFLILAAAYIILRMTVLNFIHGSPLLSQYAFTTRIFTFFKTIFIYLRVILLPFDLHMSRNVILSNSLFEPQVLLSFIGLIIIVAIAVYFYHRQRIISFAIVWFFANLISQSGIFPINAFIAEHFIYVSGLGVFLITAFILKRLLPSKIFIFISIIVLCGYSLVTIMRNYEWARPLVFYQKLVKYSPFSFAGHNNLAVLLEEEGAFDLAIKEYNAALEVNPSFLEPKINLLRVYYKKGLKDKFKEQALLLKSKHYTSVNLHSTLARIYVKEKEFNKAINEFKLALNSPSPLPDIYNDLALSYREIGNINLAIDSFKKAINIDNTNASYHNNLGVAFKAKGNYQKAIEEYLKAVKIAPGLASSWNNLGVIYASINQLDKAEILFQKAIKLDSQFIDAYYNLGRLYLQKGDHRQAKECWQRVLSFEPQNIMAKEALRKLK